MCIHCSSSILVGMDIYFVITNSANVDILVCISLYNNENFSRAVVLKFVPQNQLEGCLNRFAGLVVSYSGSLGWVPRICISDKFSSANYLLIQELKVSAYRSS